MINFVFVPKFQEVGKEFSFCAEPGFVERAFANPQSAIRNPQSA